MQDRFRQHLGEAHTFDINDKFGDLQQQLEKTLLAYHRRESSLTKHVGVRDRPENGDFSLAISDGFFSMVSSGHL